MFFRRRRARLHELPHIKMKVFHSTARNTFISFAYVKDMHTYSSEYELEDISRLLGDGYVNFVEVSFQGLDGETRSRFFKASRAADLLDGFRVDGYSTGFKPVEDSDLVVVPDPQSLKVWCLEGRCFAFLAGDLFYEDRPFEHCPRRLLRSLLERLPGEFSVGLELELYLLKGEKPVDARGYWAPDGQGITLLFEAAECVKSGLELYSVHHEVGPGQYEVLFPPTDPLRAADNAVFAKRLIKSVASSKGFTATFMAKPFSSLPGSGMHIHVSAKLGRGGAFFEDGALREEGVHFIGGLLSHAKPLSALTNQTVNSYKRLVPGMEAPFRVSWGFGNRSALVRIPKSRRRSGTIEFRLPDASGNIYLAIVATLVAGFIGLEKRVDPGEPLTTNAYLVGDLAQLPSSLSEALRELIAARVSEFFHPGFIEAYHAVKRAEWEEYLKHCGDSRHGVTAWELEKYMNR